MPNRLADASSLYLRQHADNPVEWYPWGQEALDRAQKESKPIIVSIGYSACHWCHVMAHESFEDSFIANLMNEHFICIKVDREERPDLDHFYMEAVQMMNGGHGGWPLNAFCLPDGRPFAGGTYFPPDEQRGGGSVPWPQLIVRVSDFFKRSRADLEENADSVMKNIGAGNMPVSITGDPLDPSALLTAAKTVLESHDDTYGGFGTAPKFPPSMTLDFLLALRQTEAVEVRQPALGQRIDEVINTTLTAMAHGGLYDQFGGGFSRYCVDQHWIIPHFEKMLYDNGLLLSTYSRAYRSYPKPLYKSIVEETIGWLDREMAAPEGGYYSALDADSEGGEGTYYVWNPETLKATLGEKDAEAVAHAYGITEEGNFEDGWSQAVLLEPDFASREALAPQREKLLQARTSRPAPGRDEKRLVAWNSLVANGLAEAAWTFGRKDWLARAVEIVDWVWNDLVVEDDSGLLQMQRGAYSKEGFGLAVIDDFASYAEACLGVAAYIDWVQPGASQSYTDRAKKIWETVEARFKDSEALGYYFTDAEQGDVLQRKKEWFDNAVPAGHSCLIHVARDLAQLTGESRWESAWRDMSAAYPGYIDRAPHAIGHAMEAITRAATGVATIKASPDMNLEDLRQAITAKPYRRCFIQVTEGADQPQGYLLCIGNQCLAPTSDLNTLLTSL